LSVFLAIHLTGTSVLCFMIGALIAKTTPKAAASRPPLPKTVVRLDPGHSPRPRGWLYRSTNESCADPSVVADVRWQLLVAKPAGRSHDSLLTPNSPSRLLEATALRQSRGATRRWCRGKSKRVDDLRARGPEEPRLLGGCAQFVGVDRRACERDLRGGPLAEEG
jgi:hypothetical protein